MVWKKRKIGGYSGVIFLGDAFSKLFRYIDKLKIDFYNIYVIGVYRVCVALIITNVHTYETDWQLYSFICI